MKQLLKKMLDRVSLVRTGLQLSRGITLGWVVAFCLAGPPFQAAAQSDNFDDGNDAGWTRYDRTGTAMFSFPDGGYRIQASSIGGSESDKALVLAYRSDEYTNFYAAVDLPAWDNSVRSAFGLVFRANTIGPGTTTGYALYWTPADAGGGLRVFGLVILFNDVPFLFVSACNVTLDPAHDYRMVVTGVGAFFEAKLFDLNDLTKPVAYMSGTDTFLPQTGKCGLFIYSRNNTTADATFDNYVAAHLDPASVPAPGTPHPIPGAPQVVNRVPVSNRNFHAPASGIAFTATTLGGNPLNPSDIHLELNGMDVSTCLSVSGSPNSREVSYDGLQSNKIYHARITLMESGGKSSTNEFTFDTFSESFITNSPVVLVQAEDYNYEGGQFQNDPVPSGLDSMSAQVNGNGNGYYGLFGTPDVDYFDQEGSPQGEYIEYRTDRVGTFAGCVHFLYIDPINGQTAVRTNDTLLQKFAALDLPDYQVHRTRGGEWLNYTREFPAGNYNAYLRLSTLAPQNVLLDEVTGDRTMPMQTTSPLGKFVITNTVQAANYRYFQLVDNSGNPVVLNWSGEKTFRLTVDSPDVDFVRNTMQLNYVMFTPVQPPLRVCLINPARNGNQFSVSFKTEVGASYTLQYKNSLSDANWTDLMPPLTGDGTVKTMMDTTAQTMRFYQVSGE